MAKARTLNPYDMEARINDLENGGGGGGGGATVVATAVSTGAETYSALLDTLYSHLGTNQAIEVDGLLLRQVGENQFSAFTVDNASPVLSAVTLQSTGSGYDFWRDFGVRNDKASYGTDAGLTIKLIQY